MNKPSKLVIFTLSLLLLMRCGSDEPESPLTLPSNLNVNVTKSNDIAGLVNVIATSQNVNFYNIYFGEISSETPTRTTSGAASYTYSQAGTYTIRVQAHVTATAYSLKEVEVTVEQGTGNGTLIIPTSGYTSPTSYAAMSLVWEDKFDGTSLNGSDWSYELGRGTNGWGNNELQHYREENTQVKDGYLIITAKKENFSGAQYTSSRIVTMGKKSFKYGRIDIRAALPKGQGIWPALWMLGDNFSTIGWPRSGEIDIMEMVGGSGREKTVHGTVHWWNDTGNSYASFTGSKTLTSGMLGDEFHVYSILWTANSIQWYLDDATTPFHTIDITPADLSEFREKFFFIFNVAVGGNWPGSPNDTTIFPQFMIVDYIRVFQQN